MASREEYQQYVIPIDLNVEWTHDLDINHEGIQLHQPDFHIPNLNSPVDDFVFDLNVTPDSPTNIEVSSSNTDAAALNLNIEPDFVEEEDDETTANLNFGNSSIFY